MLMVSLMATLSTGNAGAKTVGYLPVQGELFEKALSQVGLATDDVRINTNEEGLWGGDKYRMKLLNLFCDNPWKISSYTRSLTNGLLTQMGKLGTLVTSAHAKLDAGVRLGLVGDALEGQKKRIKELGDNALAVALSELTGYSISTYIGDIDHPTGYADIPQEVRNAAALVLLTVPEALKYRELGLTQPILKLGLDPQYAYNKVVDYVVTTFAEAELMDPEQEDDIHDVLLLESLMDNVDWNLLNTGATYLAIAVDDASRIMTAEGVQLPSKKFNYKVYTPLGYVCLSGPGDDAYSDENILLTIDTGGNDTYASCAGTRDYTHSASASIDLGGDDIYRNTRDEIPAYGSGNFGYGVLVDLAGDDRYETTYAGQGSGIFGTGLLYDAAGNDTYQSYANAQGSGTFGTGLLIDGEGNDDYSTYRYGQGYGFTRGCGLLIDGKGNDHYYANLVDHFNGGLYGDNHHVHFVQGSAYGRRADFTDGHSWAGGFGLLLDGEGNDKYEADCYGQGNSYWYAIGLCVDKSGDDVYHAGQYSQASAPHFAVGILQDDAGDDRYIIVIRQSMGHGRDWSIAWFEDAAGNDWYQGARTTLGVSHINSVSIFWDRAGDDTYLAKGPCLGESETETTGSIRDWLLTVGIFVDGGGDDKYLLLPGEGSYEASNTFTGEITDLSTLQPLDFAGNGKMWNKTAPGNDTSGFYGVGLDVE